MPNIVVVGAGVSGLTSAFLLSKQKDNVITVVAKHMPGDYDIEYASPWAGANVLPMSTAKNSSRERRTWPEIKRLAKEVPEAGIHLLKSRVYRREKDLEALRKGGYSFDGLFQENPWYKSLFDDFRELSKDELPKGMASGCEFGSACINVMLYMPWLVGQCRANGVVFRRGQIKHISEAAGLSHSGGKADVVINTTGLMASRLGGVMDSKVVPIRGQVVVVRNEAPYMLTKSGTDDAADEVCYIMMRASGGGTILGGTYQKGHWESQPDPNIAMRIMRRAVEMMPELTGGKGVEGLDVVRHGVGLRPWREGGVRIEKENIDGTWVVHNYGHAGWGYQGSYGCAQDVVALVDEILSRPRL
ncbi:FAD dependent oxidoreductase [Annulohypoxylon truncatum]|uniref:FAD dependent oxidoreductase n=1 Tax=Annulohypoxylon truncatum TaxID=327061 RepID=UPI002008AFC2|nr:FAD dependent oxidoreductase [Annulohypoxylon truncatum]KAI1211036.1 FAD dependent oxidoreductase [Annulohypoxylon truncatum]